MNKTYIEECDDFENKINCQYYEVNVLYKNDIPHDFIIGNKITEGGYGSIYETFNNRNLEKSFILKRKDILYLDTKLKKQAIKEFENEINIQNIAAQTNFTDEVELAYVTDEEVGFIMKRYKSTLSAFLKDNEISLDIKKKALKDTIDALVSISTLGIKHGDLHLYNLMVDNDNSIKIIDFGLSTIVDKKKALSHNLQMFDETLYMSLNDVEDESGWNSHSNKNPSNNINDILYKYWDILLQDYKKLF
jgi:serine/threonine protein kinase